MITRTREEVIKRWVAALRSGEYKQARHALKTDTGFCCLGVLCDLAAKDGGSQWALRSPDYYTYMGNSGVLPPVFRRFLGRGVNENKLVRMNDEGTSFDIIADYIEREAL